LVLKHDDIIRLQHQSTKYYLHSHLHQSPLTKQQEVSCYGPESDTGDNWKVCTVLMFLFHYPIFTFFRFKLPEKVNGKEESQSKLFILILESILQFLLLNSGMLHNNRISTIRTDSIIEPELESQGDESCTPYI
jgi:hypothetical protein